MFFQLKGVNVKVVVIIPAFNEEESISDVIKSVLALSYDYVVINDCSTDATESILQEMKANYVTLPINLGIGGGIQTGYQYAKKNGYDIAIQLDGDGQHDAKYIARLIEVLTEGRADIVIGSRFVEKEGFQSSFVRRAGIVILSTLIKRCSGVFIKDATSGFRAVNKKMIDVFAKDYAQDYPEPEAIITAAMYGARVVEVPVIMNDRQGGSSSISQLKSIYYMIKVSLAIILRRCFEGRR